MQGETNPIQGDYRFPSKDWDLDKIIIYCICVVYFILSIIWIFVGLSEYVDDSVIWSIPAIVFGIVGMLAIIPIIMIGESESKRVYKLKHLSRV